MNFQLKHIAAAIPAEVYPYTEVVIRYANSTLLPAASSGYSVAKNVDSTGVVTQVQSEGYPVVASKVLDTSYIRVYRIKEENSGFRKYLSFRWPSTTSLAPYVGDIYVNGALLKTVHIVQVGQLYQLLLYDFDYPSAADYTSGLVQADKIMIIIHAQ